MSIIINPVVKLAEFNTEIHKDIIERSKKGDSPSQYKLYKLYSKAMYNICCRMMNNFTEAEDILQEIFAEAFQKLSSFRYESTFGAWIKRITVNKCINELKRNKNILIFSDQIHNFDSPAEETEVADNKLNIKTVHKAIELLPEGYRVVFCLYMIEGYDHSEISQILEISESTSKSQYMRAKIKLKEIINFSES